MEGSGEFVFRLGETKWPARQAYSYSGTAVPHRPAQIGILILRPSLSPRAGACCCPPLYQVFIH